MTSTPTLRTLDPDAVGAISWFRYGPRADDPRRAAFEASGWIYADALPLPHGVYSALYRLDDGRAPSAEAEGDGA